jgi:hypothetical protein
LNSLLDLRAGRPLSIPSCLAHQNSRWQPPAWVQRVSSGSSTGHKKRIGRYDTASIPENNFILIGSWLLGYAQRCRTRYGKATSPTRTSGRLRNAKGPRAGVSQTPDCHQHNRRLKYIQSKNNSQVVMWNIHCGTCAVWFRRFTLALVMMCSQYTKGLLSAVYWRMWARSYFLFFWGAYMLYKTLMLWCKIYPHMYYITWNRLSTICFVRWLSFLISVCEIRRNKCARRRKIASGDVTWWLYTLSN